MRYIIVVILSLVFLNCNNINQQELSALEKSMKAKNHPGKRLMELHCYACHSPTASHDNRIGPPMIAIKRHYINDETTKTEFIADMQAWIKNPTVEDAKMRGAVKRFGVMPKQPFSEEAIEDIADYMYNYDIAQPDWFEDHFKAQKGKHQHKGKGQGKGKGKHRNQEHKS